MTPAQNVVNDKLFVVVYVQIVHKLFFKFKVNSSFDLQLSFLQLNC